MAHPIRPAVRAVHRITIPSDDQGRIDARHLMDAEPLPAGAVVVLQLGDGWWLNRSDLQHIHSALSRVEQVSVTGNHRCGRTGGVGQFGLIYGIDAIAAALTELRASDSLSQSA